MKPSVFLFVLVSVIVPTLSFANTPLRCKKEVTFAIEKTTMFNVVQSMRSIDGVLYEVKFRTASGDAEQVSNAEVTVDPKDCRILKVKYTKGAH